MRKTLRIALAAMLVAAATPVLLAVARPALALENGLARTPQMGWNDWNSFGCNVSDTLIRQTADAMVSSGMSAAGYKYVNIDDCWSQSGRCLDVPNGNQTNGTLVSIYDCNGGSTQSWTATAAGELRTAGGKCLDVSGAATADGTNVEVWDCNGQTNQRWQVQSNGTVTGVGSGKCLDVYNNGTANGTAVEIWSCNSGANQQWTKAGGS